MTVKDPQKPALSAHGAAQAARKAARQAAALRANLGKRKAQARERDAVPDQPPAGPDSPRRA